MLCNIHICHDLQSRYYLSQEAMLKGEHICHTTIHTHTDPNCIVLWLDMDIRCMLINGTLEDGIHKTNGWCILILPLRSILFCSLANGEGSLFLHVLDSRHRSLILIKNRDCTANRRGISNHRSDLFSSQVLHLLYRDEIQRILHG